MAVFIVADPGATWRIPGEPWDASRIRAGDLIRSVADAGADVIKFQVYRGSLYPNGTPEAALLSQYELPREWLPSLSKECARIGIEFAATPFDLEAVELLDPLVKRWKISSFESRHSALIEAMLRTGKPIIASTGMMSHQEAVQYIFRIRTALRRHREDPWPEVDLTVLHCVSAYPATPQDMNLAWIGRMLGRHGVRVGLSDHSVDHHAAVMAVALGATVIERHVRADDTPQDNPDFGDFSDPPAVFEKYVDAIRKTEIMLGDGEKRLMESEWVAYRWDPQTGRRGVV